MLILIFYFTERTRDMWVVLMYCYSWTEKRRNKTYWGGYSKIMKLEMALPQFSSLATSGANTTVVVNGV
jgi:hypothetical protein